MNDVKLLGNLTRDPELRKVNLGDREVSVVNFVLAVSRHFKKNDSETRKETTFIPCEAWDTGAETIAKYLQKGSKLLVSGILRNDSWETAEGEKRSKLKVRVSNFNMFPRYKKDEDSE